jgi:hypothetical protein
MPSTNEHLAEIVIRTRTHSSLAKAYGVSPKVLTGWLRPHCQAIGRKNGYYYSLEQLFIVFDLFSWPPEVATYQFYNKDVPGNKK